MDHRLFFGYRKRPVKFAAQQRIKRFPSTQSADELVKNYLTYSGVNLHPKMFKKNAMSKIGSTQNEPVAVYGEQKITSGQNDLFV